MERITQTLDSIGIVADRSMHWARDGYFAGNPSAMSETHPRLFALLFDTSKSSCHPQKKAGREGHQHLFYKSFG